MSEASAGPALAFRVEARCAASAARVGRVETPHGGFDTPAFMPVGTQAAVKGLLPELVARTGAEIVLANTYHLMLRPGAEAVASLGGLHGFMNWAGPILTDSGGYQAFSMSDLTRLDADGVEFRSIVDGAIISLSPERAMEVQNRLGADIIMALDDCPPSAGRTSPGLTPFAHSAEYSRRLDEANERTARWLERCVQAHARRADQALFGIVQGGTDLDKRSRSVEQVCSHDLPGYAIGGVAVGEDFDQIIEVVRHTAALLPADRPRYLMGVGYERDIVEAVRAGVDMFDCVLPTRNGRNACAFTRTETLRLRNARFADDPRPIEAHCDCPACNGLSGSGGFSRAYLRHLFLAREMLGPILVSLHNLRHFQRLMLDIRRAIRENDWLAFGRRWPVAAAGPRAGDWPEEPQERIARRLPPEHPGAGAGTNP